MWVSKDGWLKSYLSKSQSVHIYKWIWIWSCCNKLWHHSRICSRTPSILLYVINDLKGYLRCKIKLLKMCHLRHRLRIVLLCRKVVFSSQDIQVFVVLTIPWFTKSVVSRWVLVHETRSFLNIFFEPQLIKWSNLANW